MNAEFFSSQLNEWDYRIFSLTSGIISGPLKTYALIGLMIFLTLEACKMIYFSQMMDFPKLLLALILFFSMFTYSDLMKGFDSEMNALYDNIKHKAGQVNVALVEGTYKGTSLEQQAKDEVSGYSTDDEKMEIFDEFFTGNMSSLIHAIMGGIRKILLMFLYAIGPVCITLSMFPLFGVKVLKNWFFYVMAVHLWELGFIILQIIQGMVGFFRGVSSGGSMMDDVFSTNGWAWACYNITIFICFGMVPYLSSKMMIGLAQPSSFAARTVAAAGMAIRGSIQSYRGRQASQSQSGEGLTNYVMGKGGGGNGGGKGSGSSGSQGQGQSQSIGTSAGRAYGNISRRFNKPNTW